MRQILVSGQSLSLRVFTAFWVAIVLSFSGPVFAERPSLSGLQNQIDDIETRLTNCEQGIDDTCQGAPGPQGPQGDKGDPGIDGLDGMDGADAPDRTVELCDLYGVLAEQSLIGALAIPDFCTIYAIGDVGPAEGIVFYVTAGGRHGLEAAPADLAKSVSWGCVSTAITGADGTAIGTGGQNTADIVAGCSEIGIAAALADAYTLNGFDDWFLPSKDELNELYLKRVVVGGFDDIQYWSSSEDGVFNAWFQHFAFGNQTKALKSNPIGVRAVRAF